MTENTQSFVERWAQALVKNCLDIVAAFNDVYPYDGVTPNGKVKSAKRKVAIFNEHWGNNQQLWMRVADLQKQVDTTTIATSEQLLQQWTVIANTDRRKLVQIVDVICRCVKYSTDGSADPECERCDGTGVRGQTVELASTASYDDAAATVYEGAEMTKHGIKVHMASRSEARTQLARYHGLFADKLAPDLPPPDLPPLPDDPVEAARLYAEWVKA